MQLIKERISEMAQGVLDGKSDTLEIYAYLKDYEAHIKACLSTIKEAAFEEAEKFGDKSFEHLGLSFELRNGKTNYNFKEVSQWQAANETRKRIEEISKASAKNGSISVDPETGEEIEPCKITYSSQSLIVKMK